MAHFIARATEKTVKNVAILCLYQLKGASWVICMANDDYLDWTKEDLVHELKRLKKRKTYGIVWEDKPEKVVELCKEKLPVLVEDQNKEISNGDHKPVNILIEGDNYHSLSVLNYTHKASIDVVYIDPPYNRGGENFVFDDNIVDINDTFRHSKWLSFMNKRLLLAKKLLRPTGFIFISIDDNEVAQLKLLCDKIFGSNNFIAQIIVEINKMGRAYLPIAVTHEYILCYAKSADNELNELPRDTELLEFEDRSGRYEIRELRNRNPKFTRSNRPNLFYPIYINKNIRDSCDHCAISLVKSEEYNIEVYPRNSKGEDCCWRWGKSLLEDNIVLNDPEESQVVAKQRRDGWWNIYEKYRKTTTRAKSIWDESEMRTELGTILLRKMFGRNVFDFPKPLALMKKVLKLSTKADSVILDFFAGSGTTAHAVLELNKEDNGNRRFIICTNNENNICTEVTYPRIEKVINGYITPDKQKIKGLGGNLKYFRTDFVDAEPIDKNKRKLTQKATEMLCVKEDTFECILNEKNFQIFKNNDHCTGIIYDQLAIPEFKEAIKDIKGRFNVYIFSLSDDTFDEEFEDIKDIITLSPIPEAILRVYRSIFK